MEISPKSIENYVSITGTVKPIKEVQFKSEMAGNYVLLKNPSTGRPFMLSDRVNEGQELILLQDEEYENNIRLSSLKISLETTKQVFDKQKSLFEKGGVTQSDVKNAEVNYINAKYAYDDAMLRLQKMKVKAPFTGTIVNLPYYTAGTKVASGSLMVGIMDYSKLYMDINLAEMNMGFVKPNQPVIVTNYSLVNDTLKGTITQLSPAIDPDTRSFKGSVEISNPNLKLRPGMFVKAEIVVASANNSIVIPKDIVISRQGANYVFVVEKGIAYERKVQFGLENNNEVLILSGLKLKDHVVSKGFETLRDGSKVSIVK
jgi:RND family efflux transporter MFP subunit